MTVLICVYTWEHSNDKTKNNMIQKQRSERSVLTFLCFREVMEVFTATYIFGTVSSEFNIIYFIYKLYFLSRIPLLK